ncbi:hypothetical protein QBC37DRAFT_462379 [Rhypophila decipiens]|uniref:Uncharacterized protein n=1 Tax=Rhypophila decipiens TaxID=261697 RepID=A0AAN6XSX1_9PEZI|nr:hypothetical protein QBC37DRAFT_462379 [Rhypophila decipiens]
MTRFPSSLVFAPKTQRSTPRSSLKRPRLSSSERGRETAAFILVFGVVMPVSCSRCKRLGLVCKTASKSESCGQCVSAGYSGCNVHGNDPSRLRAVLEEKQRLDQEERDTLAKLLRLKDQQKRLALQADELFGHEIDILQEEERSSIPGAGSLASEGGPLQSSSVVVDSPDWLAGVDWSTIDPNLLGQVGRGSGGGTAGASPGSSGAREVPTS